MYWTVNLAGCSPLANHAAVTIGNKIFSFGGYDNGKSMNLNRPLDVFLLDTTTFKVFKFKTYEDDFPIYRRCDSMPCQRYGHTAVSHGSKVYLWGGKSLAEICGILYCFDTETFKWSTPNVKGRKPIGRVAHTACKIQNCMYIYGGHIENTYAYSQEVHVLNLNTLTWSTIIPQGPQPCIRDYHSATVIGTRMYIFGGRCSKDEAMISPQKVNYSTQIHYLDTITGAWVTPVVHSEVPISRRNHSAISHNGLIYIFGGCNCNLNLHFQDVIRFDPDNCTWMTLKTAGIPPSPRRNQVCQVINDKVFIAGGHSPPRIEDKGNLSISRLNFHIRTHNDIHVFNLNPSLREICLINAWKYIKEEKIHLDELCIPPSLIMELKKFGLYETNKVEIIPTTIYDDELRFETSRSDSDFNM